MRSKIIEISNEHVTLLIYDKTIYQLDYKITILLLYSCCDKLTGLITVKYFDSAIQKAIFNYLVEQPLTFKIMTLFKVYCRLYYDNLINNIAMKPVYSNNNVKL